VAKVVNRVLDILEERGLLYKSEEPIEEARQQPSKMTTRQHIIEELIRTEKDYIGHLEMLQLLKKQLEETGKLTGDSIYSIFLNLNNILDFGRRFLIRLEQHDQLAEDQQNWGQLFDHYHSAFSVYEPFIANNSRCNATVEREWDKICMIGDYSRDLQQMVASVATLSGFLLKPFQRMTKYPMMLNVRRGG
jgi:cell division control protein 24